MGASGLRLSPPDLRAFHADCDANGDGKISLDEFLAAVQRNR
jgi:hypothetical protein